MMWWSVFLALLGVTGLYLTTQKNVLGFAVGVGVQFFWIVFALVTGQYGFLISAPIYAYVNFIGLRKWTEDARAEKAGKVEEATKALEVRFLYFSGINPDYPPHYWELKTAFGNVVQKSPGYPDEYGAIKNAVAVFGDKLFDSNHIIIDTSPEILTKLRREVQVNKMRKMSIPSFNPPEPNRFHQHQPTNHWMGGEPR